MKTLNQILARHIEHGSLTNRIRKLQRQWNYWYPRRQPNFVAGQNAEQYIADKECMRIGPLLHDAKVRKAEIEREADQA